MAEERANVGHHVTKDLAECSEAGAAATHGPINSCHLLPRGPFALAGEYRTALTERGPSTLD